MPFELTTGRRWDLFIRPDKAGKYPAVVEMRDLNVAKTKVLGRCKTYIIVE